MIWLFVRAFGKAALHDCYFICRSAEERMRLLQGTGIPDAVEKDLANIQTEYSSIILPFLKVHPEIFDPKVHTLELYTKLVAFVMAYR